MMIPNNAELADLLTKGTPGPWSAEYQSYGDGLWFGGDGYGMWTIGQAYIGGYGRDPIRKLIMDADAALIALAPELAAALIDAGAEVAKLRDALIRSKDYINRGMGDRSGPVMRE